MARRTNLKKLPRKRYKADKSFGQPLANVACTSAVIGGTTTDVTFTFSANVLPIAGGLMTSVRANGLAPVSVVSFTATTIKLRFAAAKTAGQAFTIGLNDPAVRTQAGGFVTATAGLLS